MATVTTGWRVDAVLRKTGAVEKLSRVFTVKEAAETFAKIARANKAYKEVYITAIWKSDGIQENF